MLNKAHAPTRPERGFTLVEVLVTVIILALGLMAIAQLQARLQGVELASYQRAQASALLQDILGRMQANIPDIDSYVTGTANPLGTDDAQPLNCPQANPPTTTIRAQDQCEWSRQLKGAAETVGGANIGGMIGARGCIERIVAVDATAGVCRAAVYRVSVVWQGLSETVAPPDTLACGQGEYGDERLRRVITAQITAGLPTCI